MMAPPTQTPDDCMLWALVNLLTSYSSKSVLIAHTNIALTYSAPVTAAAVDGADVAAP